MKIINKIVTAFSFILLMGTSFNATANNSPNDWQPKMMTYLSDFSIDIDSEVPDRILVDFMINDKAEIIVLSTSNSYWDKTIKSKLNYKKLASKDLKRNKRYTLPIVFEKA